MLVPDVIPDSEPLLRVGIILPEDNQKSVQIKFHDNSSYQLSDAQNKKYQEIPAVLQFKIAQNGQIECEKGSADTWIIQSRDKDYIAPQSGMIADSVIAGRGFHWQKSIKVSLPGSVEISAHKGSLILVNELPIEQYLMCVATSEMGAQCPIELLEAQVIAARSWMLANVERKHIDLGMDVCNDDCCQRYQGTTHLSEQSVKAVKNTFGKVLLYNNKICDARYSKSCGGMMESFASIWDGDELPYLRNIPDADDYFKETPNDLTEESNIRQWINSVPNTFCSPKVVPEDKLHQYLGSVDEEGTYFRWQYSLSQKEMTALFNKKTSVSAQSVIAFKALNRGGSGRINKLAVIYLDQQDNQKEYIIVSEFEVRRILHDKFLYSGCIYIDFDQDKKEFTIKGAGWGHGVGLCQIGALGMSLKGYSSEKIVLHYYPGSQLKKIY